MSLYPTEKFSVDAKEPWYRIDPKRWKMEGVYKDYSYFDEQAHDCQHDMKPRIFTKGDTELDCFYKTRLDMSDFAPVSRTAINKILGSIYQEVPSRTVKLDLVEKWMQDVDGCGSTFEEFSKGAANNFLVYGSVYNVLQYRSALSANVYSLADQLPNLSPIIRSFCPIYYLNKVVDESGKTISVWYWWKDFRNDGREVIRWLNVGTMESVCYELPLDKPEETPAEVSRGVHNLGVIPVGLGYGMTKYDWGLGSAYIAESYKLDFKLARQESDLEYDRTFRSHPLLKVWAEEELGKIISTAKGYLKLHNKTATQEKEDAAFLQLDEASFNVNMKAIEMTKRRLAEKLQMDPLGSQDAGETEVSGVRHQLSYKATEQKLLSTIARRVEAMETQILRLVHQMLGYTGDLDEIRVTYPRSFSLDSDDILLDTYSKSKDYIDSREWKKTMLMKIAVATIGNDPEVLAIVETEIDQALDSQDPAAADNVPIDAALQSPDLTSEHMHMLKDKLGVDPATMGDHSVQEM
jgi:hypothetical protein